MESEAVDCLVVGGGAAGMMAAIRAAEAGASVRLLEGGREPGRKILISGNGRCNLLNVDGDDPSRYHGTHPRFVRPALEALPVAQTLRFFEDLGVVTKQEKRGRLFPQSDQARSVVDLLLDRMQRLGVRVEREAKACRLTTPEGGGFRVDVEGAGSRSARRVVLCSGGLSVPKLGADDSGIRLAEGLGHTRTSLYPGLVALESPEPWVRRLAGLKVWARVQAAPGRATVVDTDDLLFAKYGLSGFTILNLSAVLVRPLRESGPLELTVSCLPEMSPEEASERLRARWQAHPHRSLGLSLAGWVHERLGRALIERAGLDAEAVVADVTKAQRWELARLLTGCPITVTGPREFDYAEVMIGGVRTDEIDPHTMQSYVVPDLFFAGEMVDVHGDLGGFNFQWAWSSGTLAGRQAAAG